MTPTPVSIAGNSPEDTRLWNTYVFWARSSLDPRTQHKNLLISPASNRVRHSTGNHLQAIVFTAFALEYRIKRIYDVLDVAYRKKDTLGALLANFSRRVQSAQRLDGKGAVRLPAEWASIEAKLKQLNQRRNGIAHANYQEVAMLLPRDIRRSRAVARSYFNALVDAIRVTNRAVGYEDQTPSRARRGFARLKIR